jgi:hypothetical protein
MKDFVIAFAFTFATALGHAVLLGLPLFLVFRSKGWINVMSCVVCGFAVGAVPAGVLTWPMQHPELHTSALVDGVQTIINGVIIAAGWVSYVRPLIYFGSFGALGGFAFWVALIGFGTFGKAAAVVVRLIRGLMESFDSQDSSASPKESTPFIRITCLGGKQRQGSITTDNAKESHAYQR